MSARRIRGLDRSLRFREEEEVPPADVEPWSVAQLDFDQENARLPEDLTDRTEPALIRHFADHYDLEELAWSMAEKGYFEEEPLLTISNPSDASRRIVVEGNRRLATLKLLTDQAARVAAGDARWSELSTLASDKNLESVPTRNYANRRELLEYLGFRHVSGILQWSADAKARFVYSLITEYGYQFDTAAKVIGSRSDAIRRQFVSWGAVRQARDQGVDVAEAVDHFGVFYRSLQNPKIREFIGLQGWMNGDESLLNPLSGDGPERLEELLGFIFGRTRVIKESRQLDDLGRALGDGTARSVLRESRDLTMALQELPADRDALLGIIRIAYRQAARANAEAYQFKGDEQLLGEATRLEKMAEQLRLALEV